MVREQGIAPPSKAKRLLGYLGRWRNQFQLIFQWVGDETKVMEIAELQLHLSEVAMTAVNRMRQGTNARVSDEDNSDRCFLKLSVELFALAWSSEVPGLVGLDQITDLGVMSTNGEFRSWRALDPEVATGADGLTALRRLLEAATLEAATATPETAASANASNFESRFTIGGRARMSTRGGPRASTGPSGFGSASRDRSRSATPSMFKAAMNSRLSRRPTPDFKSGSSGETDAEARERLSQAVLAPEDDDDHPLAAAMAANGSSAPMSPIRPPRKPLNGTNTDAFDAAAQSAKMMSRRTDGASTVYLGPGKNLPQMPDPTQAVEAIRDLSESFYTGDYARPRLASITAAAHRRSQQRSSGKQSSEKTTDGITTESSAESPAESSKGGGVSFKATASSWTSTRALERRADAHAAHSVFAGSGLIQAKKGSSKVLADSSFKEEKRGQPRRMYITYRTPQNHARYVLFDLFDLSTLYAWLVGMDALCKSYIDVCECRVSRPSMMPWMRAVFTSIVETERKARGAVNIRSWPVAIAIGARSLPSVFGAANLTIGSKEAATLLRFVYEGKDERLKKLLLKNKKNSGDEGGGELSTAAVSQLMRQRVSFIDFQQIMKTALIDERIAFTWRQHAVEGKRMAKTTGGGRMTLSEWLKFNHDVQGDLNDAANEAAFLAVAGDSTGLTQLQFQWMLLGADNSAIDHSRMTHEKESAAAGMTEEAYLDQPMAHYWVSCSHNTFLDGDQLASHSTPDM